MAPPLSPAAHPPAGTLARLRRWTADVAFAFRSCTGALPFIWRHGLATHVFAIFLLLLLVTASLWTAGWFVAGALADHLLALLPLVRWGLAEGGSLETLGHVLGWLLHLTLVVPLGLALLWLQQPILQALGFPLFDRLTERVEAVLGQRAPEHHFDLPRYLRMLVVVGLPNTFGALLRGGSCYLLGFLPIIGLYFIARGFVYNAYYSGYGVLENYFENRGWDLRRSRDEIRARQALAVGIGFWVNLLALVPFLGSALALTLGTVGGGIALHRWEGRAPAAPRLG
jgi:uncharacterized protein involved in cysteine biosynthesis